MINTMSKFYFGTEVTLTNFYLNFDEGGSELTAILKRGYYSLTDFAVEIARAMTAVGGQTYSVSVNRVNRRLTISASSSFTLRIATGSNVGSDIYSLAGFTGTNVTGTSLTGGSGAGYEYVPQFRLQDYVKPGQRKETIESTINETGSGRIEVVKFGLRSLIEMNIRFITSVPQGGAIEHNPEGYEDAEFFMTELIKRGDIEFMPDRDDTSTFYEISLESTEADSKGLKFKLIEEPAQDYYRTGKLVFRIN